jgi:hypothetical protein
MVVEQVYSLIIMKKFLNYFIVIFHSIKPFLIFWGLIPRRSAAGIIYYRYYFNYFNNQIFYYFINNFSPYVA